MPQTGYAEQSDAEAKKALKPDEQAAHLQRAEKLLACKQPREAFQQQAAVYDMHQEPRRVYLKGLACQQLGENREAFFLFQRFLVASGGACCADERADASRRIATLRPLIGPIELVPLSPGMQIPGDPRLKKRNGPWYLAIVIPGIVTVAAAGALFVYGFLSLSKANLSMGL